MLSFIIVVIVLFLIPGPAVLLIISKTAQGGRKTGIITGIGIAIGDLIHTIAAVLGLSAILMTSALAFEIVKYLGAAYLIFLGIKSLLEKSKKQEQLPPKKSSTVTSFRQALLIELLNPKTALFFLAFLPQFVHNNGTHVVIQLLTLGLTFVLMSILYTTLLTFLTSSIGERLFSNQNNWLARWQGKVVGAIYIGLGIKLVLQTQK
ncbi:LysE family translocator [Bacillus sp. MM2020_1]|nr:LysE family translocator [Bacillus sp. MM2020_1]